MVPVGKPLELPFDPIDRAARIWEARFGPSPSMAAEFGLGGYEPGQLKEIFDLLRGLRLANGDFVPEIPDQA